MPSAVVVRVALALLFVSGLVWPVGEPVGAGPADGAILQGTPIKSVYVRPPRGATPDGSSLQVLVALHGMGGDGKDFGQQLIDHADRNGWLLVAPTVQYGDWRDPAQVAAEDPVIIQALAEYLDQLPTLTGLRVRKRALFLGHSRGAQLAHRFAEFRPDKALAVAAVAAGTYTLPLAAGPQGAGLAFPFGIGDLQRYGGRPFDPVRFGSVQFWVGVGGDDTSPTDVPRQWDAQGTTRVQRAKAFESAMRQLGASVVLRVFGGAKHDLTPEMRSAACAFLSKAELPRMAYGAPLVRTPVTY
jgi:pimeloyl-ACP methyl ester carboxylesterase